MQITSKGQITIPIDMREKLGLLPDCEVVFELEHEASVSAKRRKPTPEVAGWSPGCAAQPGPA